MRFLSADSSHADLNLVVFTVQFTTSSCLSRSSPSFLLDSGSPCQTPRVVLTSLETYTLPCSYRIKRRGKRPIPAAASVLRCIYLSQPSNRSIPTATLASRGQWQRCRDVAPRLSLHRNRLTAVAPASFLSHSCCSCIDGSLSLRRTWPDCCLLFLSLRSKT